MDMDFPHPRHAARTGLRKADYVSLVATATARQATCRTVSALLSAPHQQLGDQGGDSDVLGSRIAFFARTGRTDRMKAKGAFWMSGQDQNPIMPNIFEFPINLTDSTDSNADQLETVKPDLQAAERGTEL